MNLLDKQRELNLVAAGWPQKKRKPAPRTLEQIKMDTIRETLASFGNHRKNTAERLGISLRTLYRYIRRMKEGK